MRSCSRLSYQSCVLEFAITTSSILKYTSLSQRSHWRLFLQLSVPYFISTPCLYQEPCIRLKTASTNGQTEPEQTSHSRRMHTNLSFMSSWKSSTGFMNSRRHLRSCRRSYKSFTIRGGKYFTNSDNCPYSC
jgi:hypothetical protein